MEPKVSVIITIRNVEKYIETCLKSILDQTIKDFELVIVDDMSSDNTQQIIEKFDDYRIKYFRNPKRLGLTKNRNKGLSYATGEYIFFTDGDCAVSRDWIAQGLNCFRETDCVGVEGKIYYVSKDYAPTFSDHFSSNETGGLFMTGNMAYKKTIIETIGGFDEKYSYHEDRDLALRILKKGRICFNPNMIVYVQKEILTPREIVRRIGIAKNRVYLFKRFGDKALITWRIVDPVDLARIVFPPLVFAGLLSKRFQNTSDYRLLPFTYVRSILERLQLWKTCAEERVFLI
jgi:glycosyltransferase involved in cell wall biosynthesis